MILIILMLHVITLLLSTLNRSNDFNSRVINNRSYQLHETVCELRNSNMIPSLLFLQASAVDTVLLM